MPFDVKPKAQPKNVLPKRVNEKTELKKRKTNYSNTYLNPDGSFSLEVASKPINFLNRSGNLQDISSTLINKVNGDYQYENAANSFIARFAQNNVNNKLVYFAIDELHWITFTPIEQFTQIGSTKDNSIYYKGIRQNVDLEYIVDNDGVKERIILNSYPGSNIFTFNIDYSGVKLERQPDGSIWVLDNITNTKLFVIKKPVAVDAIGNVTDFTTITISNDIASERMVIVVDNTWLKNAEYPVIVDPAVVMFQESSESNNIMDTYIASGYPTTNYSISPYLHAGYLDYGTSNYKIYRSLIKFKSLPTIPPGAKVTSAFLSMFMYLGSTSGTTVNLHKITGSWVDTQVNWNNQPSIDATPIVLGYAATPNTLWGFDITNAVNDWYLGTSTNYGLMLRATNEGTPKVSFYSSNEAAYTIPKITINYKMDGLGVEPFYGFAENVNVYNGNMVLTDIDVALPGRGIPIAITRAYNLRSEDTTMVGYRWRLNVYMKLTYVNDEIVRFTDADGTDKIFTKALDGTYRAPVSVKLKLSYSNNTFTLEEQSGIKYHFNIQGKLDSILDTNNNTTTISYLGDGNIDKITDASGRQVVFSYLGGKLYRITGNEITTVEYAYSGNNLTAVRFLSTSGTVLQQIIYGYDVNNFMTTITDGEENITSLTYFTVAPLGRRLKTIENKLTMNGQQQTLITTYNYQINADGVITTVTDPKSYITEYETNSMGEVIRVIEDKNGLNLTSKYEWDEQNNIIAIITPKGNTAPNPADYSIIFGYDDKFGNLTMITDQKNKSTKLEYNNLNLPDEITDFAGVPYIAEYDANRNEVLTSDPLFSTVVSDYDSKGNVIYQTDPIGLGNNLINNSGFEDWSGVVPTGWTKLGAGGAISKDIIQFVNGSNSAKLVSFGSSEADQAILLSDIIPIKESSKYNVSWFVKTENAGESYGGATVDIHFYNASGIWLGGQVRKNIAPTTGTTGAFIRKGARINTPVGVGASFAKIALKLTGGAAQATAWFDNV